MEPHLDIDAHFKRHERFLVIPCVCKREQGVRARPQLPAADEALWVRRTATPDPTWGNRAGPGGCVKALWMNSRRWGMFTWRSMDSPWERRRRSSSARVTAVAVAVGCSAGSRTSVWRKRRRDRTTAPSSIRTSALPAACASTVAQWTPLPMTEDDKAHGGTAQVYRLWRVRDRLRIGCDRDGAGLGRGVVPCSLGYDGMGRDASAESGSEEVILGQTVDPGDRAWITTNAPSPPVR